MNEQNNTSSQSDIPDNGNSGGNAGKGEPFHSTPNISDNKVMAILAYIGPLVIVSYLMTKDDEFVKFHAKQGLVVFGLEVIIWILGSMMYGFWMIMQLLNLATLVLSIIGIVNVVQGNKKELPVVGALAKNINI